MMHLVTPLPKVESKISKDSNRNVVHITKLREIVIAYVEVFSYEECIIGWSNITQHEIHTEDFRPIGIPPRQVPVHYEQNHKELILEMSEKRNKTVNVHLVIVHRACQE